VSLPRPTIRARLTLLYTGLFALCGAIIVAVSYAYVAHLQTSSPGGVPGGPACQSSELLAHPNGDVLHKCISSLQGQGELGERKLILSHLLAYSLLTVAVVVLLAVVLGWIFAGRALRPVHLITAAARAASEHNLSARVALSGPHDELRELGETFDEMLARLQAAFEGQRQFIANASHELRTPLAVMRTTVDVVVSNPASTPDDLLAMGADIRVAVDHAEQLIGALLILARNEGGLTVREEVDLATAAEDVLDTASLGDRRVHASLEPAVISGDPVLTERLVANLIDNAVRYNTAGGEIWVSTDVAAGSSRLTVANTGPAISPADADRIFRPFQRLNVRTSRDGFGLGLAIVASIAAIHGGTATASPRSNGGLSVTVTIPSAGPQGIGILATDRPGIARPG
jgi:signal transduction histidine kinase